MRIAASAAIQTGGEPSPTLCIPNRAGEFPRPVTEWGRAADGNQNRVSDYVCNDSGDDRDRFAGHNAPRPRFIPSYDPHRCIVFRCNNRRLPSFRASQISDDKMTDFKSGLKSPRTD